MGCATPERLAAAAAFLAFIGVAAPCVPVVAQSVLWQVPAYAGSSDTTGVGIAFVAPATLFVTGHRQFLSPIDQNTHSVRWLTRFTLEGLPLDPQPATPPQSADDDVPRQIVGDSSGVYVTGTTRRGCTPIGCVVARSTLSRHLATGETAWSFVETSDEAFSAMAAGASGVFVVSGSVARYFGSAGALVWSHSIDTANFVQFSLPSAAAQPGEQFVVVGSGRRSINFGNPLLAHFGDPGAWGPVVRPGNGAMTRVISDALGNIYVFGINYLAGGGFSGYVVSFSPTGLQRWLNATPEMTESVGLADDRHGNLIASGRNGDSAVTTKFAVDGTRLWTDTVAGSSHASSLAVDSTGNVYVAGYMAPPGQAVFIRKLGPHGNVIWTTRFQDVEAVQLVVAADALIVMTQVPGAGAQLMRLDVGAAGPPAASISLEPLGAIPTGQPFVLAAMVRGAVAPGGTVTFRIRSSVACAAVPLQPADASTSRAECRIAQGLPAGAFDVALRYSGDASNAPVDATFRLVAADPGTAEVPALSGWALAIVAALLALVGARARLAG